MDEPSLNPYESPKEVDARSTRRPKPKQAPATLSGMGRVFLIFFGFLALIMLHSFLNALCIGGYGNSSVPYVPPSAPSPVTAPPSP